MSDRVEVPRELLERVLFGGNGITMLLTDARIAQGGLCSDEYVRAEQDAWRDVLMAVRRILETPDAP